MAGKHNIRSNLCKKIEVKCKDYLKTKYFQARQMYGIPNDAIDLVSDE